jgi:hypothetical protein
MESGLGCVHGVCGITVIYLGLGSRPNVTRIGDNLIALSTLNSMDNKGMGREGHVPSAKLGQIQTT